MTTSIRVTRGGLSLSERNRLIEDHLALVSKTIRCPRYRRYSELLGFDEAYSVGVLDMVQRAEAYRPNTISRHSGEPVSFAGYAFRAIGLAVIKAALRRHLIPDLETLLRKATPAKIAALSRWVVRVRSH